MKKAFKEKYAFIKIFRNMKFQTKLLLTYSLFIVVLLLVLCMAFYKYNAYFFQKNVENNMSQTTSILLRQLDNTVKDMDNTANVVISDVDITKEISDYSKYEKADVSNKNLFNNSKILKSRLEARTVTQGDIYRVSLFNTYGDIVSTKNIDGNKNYFISKIQKFLWIEDIRKSPSKKFIREPHYDDWLNDKHVQVFSFIKMIQNKGSEIGYLEIQQRSDKLSQICDVKNDENVMIAVINEKGKVIYSSWKLLNNVLIKHYMNIAKDKDKQTVVKNNPFSELPEIVSYQHSDYTGWTVLMIENKEKLFEPLKVIRNTMFLVIFGIIVLSVTAFSVFSTRLTIPLRHLKEEMEKINVDNLPDSLQIKQLTNNDNDEIEALNSSFNRMRERLNQAMKTEMRSRSLQLKAHFDALQSQINPHFLYNILGVIPTMGDEEDILDACLRLADMLRYSTSSNQGKTTIKDEITHATNYLILMKKRFEYRLEYVIEVDEALLEVEIPKLVIQPLIENSISHGFDHSNQPIMKINIKVQALENEWSIIIMDNGSGFEKGVVEELQLRFRHYANSLLSNEDIEELKIGGMGLTNTFARLFLFYGQQLKFELKNNESEGACINIRGSMSEYKQIGGNKNV